MVLDDEMDLAHYGLPFNPPLPTMNLIVGIKKMKVEDTKDSINSSSLTSYLYSYGFVLIFICWLLPPTAQAQAPSTTSSTPSQQKQLTPEKLGLKIATQVRKREKGFGNFTASQTMVLRNKKGQKSQRQLRVRVLETADDGDKSLFIFDSPKDVKGTALLIHTHIGRADEQWLYLPSLKRVKRISSSNQSSSFMGSEFAYEDMSAQEVEKFNHRYLRDESCGPNLTCTVLERSPKNKKSGYLRQLIWHDKKELRAWKVEYYDRKDSHLKTLTVKNYKKYLNHHWRASRMTMVNHLTGKNTLLTWSQFQFATSLKDSNFSRKGLKQIR